MSKALSIIVSILLALQLAPTLLAEPNEPVEPRTWTDATGKMQVQADFVAHQPGRVWLRRIDGRTFEIDIKDLSKADQEYLRRLVARRDAELEKRLSKRTDGIQYGPPRRLGALADKAVTESSGLIASRRHPGLFWTHNDSGHDPRLHLLDRQGRNLGSVEVDGAFAYDWEDIAAVEFEERSCLLVGDIGNNGRAAAVQMIHLVEEPPLGERGSLTVPKLAIRGTIYYSYEDDHRNCEAMAVDPTDRTIVLVTKERTDPAIIYTLAWPKSFPERAIIARRIGTLDIPTVSAMDISPDGLRAIVLTYTDAFEYLRKPDESWADALAQPPRRIVMPERRQGESIAFGSDGKTLYLTSEKLPAPLWEVPVVVPPETH